MFMIQQIVAASRQRRLLDNHRSIEDSASCSQSSTTCTDQRLQVLRLFLLCCRSHCRAWSAAVQHFHRCRGASWGRLHAMEASHFRFNRRPAGRDFILKLNRSDWLGSAGRCDGSLLFVLRLYWNRVRRGIGGWFGWLLQRWMLLYGVGVVLQNGVECLQTSVKLRVDRTRSAFLADYIAVRLVGMVFVWSRRGGTGECGHIQTIACGRKVMVERMVLVAVVWDRFAPWWWWWCQRDIVNKRGCSWLNITSTEGEKQQKMHKTNRLKNECEWLSECGWVCRSV